MRWHQAYLLDYDKMNVFEEIWVKGMLIILLNLAMIIL
jgi:hypothetical protein